MHPTGSDVCEVMYRMGSRMCSGPVEQLKPTTSTPSDFENGQHRRRVGSEQHPPGHVERHRGHDRDRTARRRDGSASAEHRCLGLENVLLRLDDQEIGTTCDECGRLLQEDRNQVAKAQAAHRWIARRGQEAGRTDAPGDKASPPVRGLVLIGDPAGQARGRAVQLLRDLGLAPFLEPGPGRLKRGGFQDVAAGFEEGSMDALDNLRRVEDQTVHPSLEPLAAEILDAGILDLLAGPHRTVKNEHALAERVEE